MERYNERKLIETYMEEQNFEQAWDEFKKFKIKYADDVQCKSLEALLYILNGEIDKAENLLTDAYSINNSDYDVLYELGLVGELKNNKLKAAKHYLSAKDVCDMTKNTAHIDSVISGLLNQIRVDIISGKEKEQDYIQLLHDNNLIQDEHLYELALNKYPASLIIETIRGCNLKCIFCPLQVDDNVKAHGVMSDKTFSKVLADISQIESIKQFILHNLGEPLLDKKIFSRIRMIKDRIIDCKTLIDSNLSVDFNIVEMVNSGLDAIDIAFDGANQQSYSKYRKNGNLDKLISNMVRIATTKKLLNTDKPTIQAKTVLFKHLVPELDVIANISSQCGANKLILQHAIFIEGVGEEAKEWIPKEQNLSRYNVEQLHKHNKLTFLKNRNEQEKCCNGILSTIPPVIDFEGNVYPCCYCCTLEEYNMGNINNKSFQEIWQSNKYVDFRLNILKNRFCYDICSKCYRPTNQL